MTTLVQMRPEAFASFASTANAAYAQDNVRAGRWAVEDASALAEAEFAQLLPQGIETPDHHFYEIQDEATGATVGHLWVAVMGTADARSAYVYNIAVNPDARRRGHARAALLRLEELASARAIRSIRLNVFAHNPAAQALYRSLGFEVMSSSMRKPLADSAVPPYGASRRPPRGATPPDQPRGSGRRLEDGKP